MLKLYLWMAGLPASLCPQSGTSSLALSITGGGLVFWASFFDHFPPVPVFAPPHQTIWRIFSLCLRIWPILCTQFMTMARVVVGSGGSDICVVEFSYFVLCKVPCREGLRSSAVYLGDFLR